MSEPLTVGINKLSLRAGDVVAVTVSDSRPDLTVEECDRITEAMRAVLPEGVRCVVLMSGFGVTVLRQGERVEPDVDAPALVTVP